MIGKQAAEDDERNNRIRNCTNCDCDFGTSRP